MHARARHSCTERRRDLEDEATGRLTRKSKLVVDTRNPWCRCRFAGETAIDRGAVGFVPKSHSSDVMMELGLTPRVLAGHRKVQLDAQENAMTRATTNAESAGGTSGKRRG